MSSPHTFPPQSFRQQPLVLRDTLSSAVADDLSTRINGAVTEDRIDRYDELVVVVGLRVTSSRQRPAAGIDNLWFTDRRYPTWFLREWFRNDPRISIGDEQPEVITAGAVTFGVNIVPDAGSPLVARVTAHSQPSNVGSGQSINIEYLAWV